MDTGKKAWQERLDSIISTQLLVMRMITNVLDNYTNLADLDKELPDKILKILYTAKKWSYDKEHQHRSREGWKKFSKLKNIN